jgi:hypothetical protein
MRHKIENMDIGEYDTGWTLNYTYKGFAITQEIPDEEIIKVLKTHYYSYLDEKIEKELYE